MKFSWTVSAIMICVLLLVIMSSSNHPCVSALAATTTRTSASTLEILRSFKVLDFTTGTPVTLLLEDNQSDNEEDKVRTQQMQVSPKQTVVLPVEPKPQAKKKKSLIILLPQLGEFDSSEFCEYLVAISDDLERANIALRVVGIGDTTAGVEFCSFTGLSPNVLCLDQDGRIHDALNLHSGPGFQIPDIISNDILRLLLRTLPGGGSLDDDENMIRPVATAWLNYLAMCAGIGAPGTLSEILRGYFGDSTAPERFRQDDVVQAGFITIGPGVGPVTIGPLLKYKQWFSDERGYQRPVELATIRLKNMVEVLTNWDKYVTNPQAIAQRGATYLVNEDQTMILYEYQHRGVLTYSETMARPLTFLAPYIGEDVARNPLKMLDYSTMEQDGTININKRGRGILKPIGKAMGILAPLFRFENKFQAQVLGADPSDLESSKAEIEREIKENPVVIYTYDLSPFSLEAIALLEEEQKIMKEKIGSSFEIAILPVGREWFLLDKAASTKRAALLELTGQSSLPHIFIGGKHVGGLFTKGTKDDDDDDDDAAPVVKGGLAELKELGVLSSMIQMATTAASS